MNDNYCVPFVAAIIERQHNGKTELLIQTRYHTNHESIYNGTLSSSQNSGHSVSDPS